MRAKDGHWFADSDRSDLRDPLGDIDSRSDALAVAPAAPRKKRSLLGVMSGLAAGLLLVGALISNSRETPSAVAGFVVCVTVYLVVSLCGWGSNSGRRTRAALRWLRVAGFVCSVVAAWHLSGAWTAV